MNQKTFKNTLLLGGLTVGFNLFVILLFLSGFGIDCEFILIWLLYIGLCGLGLLLIVGTMGISMVLLLRGNHKSASFFLFVIALWSVVMIISAVVFSRKLEDKLFEWRAAQYEQVIQLIESGELQTTQGIMAQLPIQYRHLSACGGEIAIDQSDNVTRVLFFTYRGYLSEIGGYIYRSDDLEPQANDFGAILKYPGWDTTIRKKPHWYYVYHD